MKTIRTIATVILAAFLVLGPVAAFGATSTMTLSTNSASYSGMANITISGTISPAPTVASNVIITTVGTAGAVDIGSSPVATGTGAFSYTLVSGGNANWVSGTYTVNATWGAQGNTATKTTTFTYGGGSTGTTTVTITSTVTSGVATTTITSSDAAALATITTDLAGLQSSLNILTTSIGTITTALTTVSNNVNALSGTLSSIQSAVNTANQGITGLTTTLAGIASNISTVNGIGTQLTSLTNAVNNNQTYVLVVAALAAITLVLELAILVRKLS
jgi:hypothetical protein